jgi:predicted nucleic acid-binding protein
MLVAAVALSSQLPLYTRNPDDFAGLTELLEIVCPVP